MVLMTVDFRLKLKAACDDIIFEILYNCIHSHAMYNVLKCNIHDYTIENF